MSDSGQGKPDKPDKSQHETPQPTASFWRKYIFSLDHKVVGLQYFFLALFAALLGVMLSLFMRLRLGWPAEQYPLLSKLMPVAFKGGTMSPEFYLALMTMHGTIMIFFVLTTVPQGGFGNYFLPLQLGVANMAFPRLSALSFWTTLLALLVLLAAFFVEGGAPLSGWTGYPTLSVIGQSSVDWGQNLWILSLAIFCLASIIGALNFVVTILIRRAPGMSLMRMPLTCWSWLTTAMLSLLAFPILLIGGIFLLLDRLAGTSFFVPGGLVIDGKLIAHSGGAPLLWQHLFWFFGHPEVYIAILPGMGIVSHVLAIFARKPVFGYRVMALAMVAIGVLGFLIWGHHMFVSGLNPYAGIAFSVLTLAIGVPSAIKTVNWLGTLWGGALRFTPAMMFAIGFISLFISGGLSGVFLGQSALDLYLHDTYFVVGHFHLIMGVASIFGVFAGTYLWFPKMFGRMMNEPLGKIHFWLTFVGVYLIFFPMYILGIAGHPRRYAQLSEFQYLAHLQPWHVVISIATFITIAAQLIFVINLFYSIFDGPPAAANPWQATTLEWVATSPPSPDNFGGIAPRVYCGPYEFSLPGAARDYRMQTDADITGLNDSPDSPKLKD